MTLLDWQLFACLMVLAYLAKKLFFAMAANIKTAGRGGYAALLAVITFPGLLLVLGHYAESRPWSDFTHFGEMPWSVVLGGCVVLPLAILIAAASAPSWYDEPLALSRGWRWTCGLVGLSVGYLLHRWSVSHYHAKGFDSLSDSITKVWSDFGASAVLTAVLLWAGVLIFRYADRTYKWFFAVLVLMQLGLIVLDLMRGLNPSGMHVACDMACGSQNLAGHLHDLLYWLLAKL